MNVPRGKISTVQSDGWRVFAKGIPRITKIVYGFFGTSSTVPTESNPFKLIVMWWTDAQNLPETKPAFIPMLI